MLTPSELLQLHVCLLQVTDACRPPWSVPAELFPDNTGTRAMQGIELAV